ncbi:hypothetical protein ACFVFS_17195 [Kitasatospora sp. NPDC057692]|uniref:hypothetical protein n=1 Tax=Kitasatospora sp. NPDC057692 TaxID=3346215 RepID=UPI0036C1D952
MPDALALPDDVLPLHIAVVEADRAMTAASQAGGDVDAARGVFVQRMGELLSHPIWEQARTGGCYAQTWQASLDAAKAKLAEIHESDTAS